MQCIRVQYLGQCNAFLGQCSEGWAGWLLLVVSGAGGDWHQGFPHDGARDARTHSDDNDGGGGRQLVSVHKWPQCK